MKIRTLVIAPYLGLAELVSSMKPELDAFDIRIEQADLQEIVPLLQQIRMTDFDLMISRGGTARLLRQHTELPVIDIQISGFDIIRILTMLKDYQSKVMMIGFPNIIESFASVANLMEFSIPFRIINNENELSEALEEAKREGVNIVLGDSITVSNASFYGMQGVLITSGRESILAAFAQAKQIFRVSQMYKQQTRILEQLLNGTEAAMAAVDRQGRVLFQNERFREKLHGISRNLFGDFPVFQHVIRDLDQGCALPCMAVIGGQEEVRIVTRKLMDFGDSPVYELRIVEETSVQTGISVSYMMYSQDQLLPFVATGQPREVVSYMEDGRPIAFVGEKGVGKRSLAVNAWRECAGEAAEHTPIMEFFISNGEEQNVQEMLRLIQNRRENSLCLINGVTRLSLKDQRLLASTLPKSACKTILLFREAPDVLRKEGSLDSKLHKLVEGRSIHLLPLRERKDAFEEYVQRFLILCNERYGKQIVGIRPAIMASLRNRTWTGNLLDLREMVELLVKNTAGEFIEEQALLEADRILRSRKHLHGGIDLNQKLEEIEKDIIYMVLRQEDMNQTTAAKRLGISRSTLWRKLK